MARGPRIVEPGQPYHLTFRGNNRRRLFSGFEDYLKFLRLVQRTLEKVDVAIHGIHLMPNHGHLMGTPGHEHAFESLMKPVLQQYAQYRNKTRDGSGKLFEERFFSKQMKNDDHYAMTHAYIDLNAVRAGIVSSPRDYRWSSYHVFARDGRRQWVYLTADICTPSSWYLELASDPSRRAERYEQWVRDVLENERRPEHVDVIDRLEKASDPYTRRLERPNRRRAR